MTAPKRVRVPREKVPHRDRIPTCLEFCTCLWTNTETPDGQPIARIHATDPECPLHGEHVKEAPY